jgi:glycosyltransferase involved in cell wall biosynthesis
MGIPEISVIIPCFNNLETLPRILDRLLKEKVNSEIIVVDNGSSDGSREYLRKRVEVQKNLIFFTEEKRGAGAARNKGAESATSFLLLFWGGDILPADNLLKVHVAAHKKNNDLKAGCLGFVTWAPELPPTPFMVFLEHGGPQNAFGEIAGKEEVDPKKYFYGSNISLKKELFVTAGGFDVEHFNGYGWEDSELGLRLAKMGFRLFYEPQARGFHWHRSSLKDIQKRMSIIGNGLVVLKKIHNEVTDYDFEMERKKYWPRRIVFGWILGWVIEYLALFCEMRFLWPTLFRQAISQQFYNSVHTAMKNKEKCVDKKTSGILAKK